MPITLNGDTGITTPTYGGADTSEYVVPVTAMKNRIINGACMIDQRNAGASLTPADGVYSLDRWRCFQSVSSKYSVQQNASSVTPPTGFINYLGATSLSAYTPTGNNYFFLSQAIEGLNCADLAWGTANAQTVTLSFWVRSSLTGSFGVIIYNSGYSRTYPILYTINSANTWEYKTITIAGDTTGTWLTTSGIGIGVGFSLGAGPTASAASGSWTSAGSIFGVTGQTQVVGTIGATFYITGVQLEKGSTATSFDYRPYGTELQLCQRYYQFNTATAGYSNSTTTVNAAISGSSVMRATPTVSLYNGTSAVIDYNVNYRNASSVSLISGINNNGCEITLTVATTTASKPQGIYPNVIAFSAEL